MYILYLCMMHNYAFFLQYYSGGDSDTILVEEYEHSQPIVVLKQAEDHIYAATSVEVTFTSTGLEI